MITEIFTLLDSVDVSKRNGTTRYDVNLNRNRIRSISAYSSNAIFYFPTIVTDQITPEEMGMVSRMLEKSYASFVVTCISLMPFHRIKSDDKASIEEYLSQFHQNIGIANGGSPMVGKMLSMAGDLDENAVITVEESVVDNIKKGVQNKRQKLDKKKPTDDKKKEDKAPSKPDDEDDEDDEKEKKKKEDKALKETQEFLWECWELSRKSDTNFIKIVENTVSLNDMYQKDPIDDKTKVIQERYFRTLEELNTWGFLGEATADMFDAAFDEGLEDLSDDDIISAMYADDGEYDEDYEEDEYGDDLEDTDLSAYGFNEGVVTTLAGAGLGYGVARPTTKHVVKKAFGTEADKLRQEIRDLEAENSYLWRILTEDGPVSEGFIGGTAIGAVGGVTVGAMQGIEIGSAPVDVLRKYKKSLQEENKRLKEEIRRRGKKVPKSLTEGNVKQAINSIMFSLESVSENKILSCNSLTKLAKLEAKLKKLKGKYAKYLNRYKKKYAENKKKGSKSKLSITFNGLSISNPKAFMKQYGGYIKIINKRLKLVEKRRAELRKRKNLPDKSSEDVEVVKLPESALGTLSDMDFQTIDYCIQSIDEALNAPDDQIFIVTEDAGDYVALLPDELRARDEENRKKGFNAGRKKGAEEGRQRGIDSAKKQNQRRYQRLEKEKAELERRLSKTAKDSERTKDLEGRIAELQKANDALKGSSRTDKQLRDMYNAQIAAYQQQLKDMEKINNLRQAPDKYGKSPPGKADIATDDMEVNFGYDRGRPKSGLNVAAYAARGGESMKVFDKEIFTDMEMKKANEALPTFAKASIGFIVDETEQVVTRDFLVGIKVYVHRAPAMDLIDDIYNTIINKRKFLKFVKFVSGEEKSLADLIFGFKELKTDALNSRGARRWNTAFKRRRRWSKISVPYLMKEYTPNGTVVLTMNEVQYIKDEYGLDIMTPQHVQMIMDAGFLLGFVILDQANEMCYVTYDGHGGEFQEYTYAMLERDQQTSDRMMRELYRSMSR